MEKLKNNPRCLIKSVFSFLCIVFALGIQSGFANKIGCRENQNSEPALNSWQVVNSSATAQKYCPQYCNPSYGDGAYCGAWDRPTSESRYGTCYCCPSPGDVACNGRCYTPKNECCTDSDCFPEDHCVNHWCRSKKNSPVTNRSRNLPKAPGKSGQKR